MKFYYFERQADGENAPAGVTVSKNEHLPEGDFRLTEYGWGPINLWFVGIDKFSEDERQLAYQGLLENEEFLLLATE